MLVEWVTKFGVRDFQSQPTIWKKSWTSKKWTISNNSFSSDYFLTFRPTYLMVFKNSFIDSDFLHLYGKFELPRWWVVFLWSFNKKCLRKSLIGNFLNSNFFEGRNNFWKILITIKRVKIEINIENWFSGLWPSQKRSASMRLKHRWN